MLAPVVVRHFAAVEIATEYGTFYLNRERLEEAIQFLSEIPDGAGEVWSTKNRLREKYPSITPEQMSNYMLAAQACVDHNVTP